MPVAAGGFPGCYLVDCHFTCLPLTMPQQRKGSIECMRNSAYVSSAEERGFPVDPTS